MLQKHQNVQVRSGESVSAAGKAAVPQKAPENKGLSGAAWLFGIGVLLTIGWLSAVGAYVYTRIGWPDVLQIAPLDLGILLLGAFAPLAFLWLLLGYFYRGLEARLKGNALDQLMANLGYPSTEAENRVARLTAALERQSKAVQDSTEKAALRIEDASGHLEKQGNAASSATDGLLKTSDRIKGELESREQQINALIDKINEQGIRLNDAITLQTSGLQNAASETEERSKTVQVALTAQISALENAIRVADEKSQDITQILGDTSEKIFATATQTLDKTVEAKDALGNQIRGLEDAANQLRQKLDDGTAHLGERGQEIGEISRNSSTELSKTADILLQSTTDLSIASDEGVTRLNALRNTLANSVAEVDKALEQLESREGGLLQVAKEAETGAKESADLLRENMQDLAVKTSEMTEKMLLSSMKLKDETAALDDVLRSTGQSLGAIDQSLRQGQELLDAASEKSLRNADQLGETLASRSDTSPLIS